MLPIVNVKLGIPMVEVAKASSYPFKLNAKPITSLNNLNIYAIEEAVLFGWTGLDSFTLPPAKFVWIETKNHIVNNISVSPILNSLDADSLFLIIQKIRNEITLSGWQTIEEIAVTEIERIINLPESETANRLYMSINQWTSPQDKNVIMTFSLKRIDPGKYIVTLDIREI